MTGNPEVASRLRQIIAELTGDPAVLTIAARTPLLRDGIGLDSLRATLLLTRVLDEFGVDVAGQDLNLDSLATLATLIAYIEARAAHSRQRTC